MKLKVRSMVATGGVAVLLFLAFQTNCFGLLNGAASLYESLPPRTHNIISRNSDGIADILRNDASAGTRAHIPVMRKDLDLSAYASLEAGAKNLTDSKLLELVLKNEGLQKQEMVDRFIRIAHLLESHQKKSMHSADMYDGSNARDDTSRGTGQSRPSPAEDESPEELSMEVVERLETIALAMKKKHKTSKRKNPRLNVYDKFEDGSPLPAWQLYHNHISKYAMYDPTDPAIDQVLEDLVSLPIVKLYQHAGGTQLKLVFYLPNSARVMWKPHRFSRDRETLPDHFYFNDYERFNAEIAAFHLDRILGFYRVPPTAGRLLNMTSDILPLADRKLAKTFYISPAGNVCFYGECSYYCDTNHAVCGSPVMLEGSMAAFLPTSKYVKRKKWVHPWRRSYNKHKLAAWRKDPDYCDGVRAAPPYDSGRRLLDLTDMAIFDFFSGNLDRHHYETFLGFGNYTFTMHLDNGRAFGKSHYDDLTILAPVTQCCLIRYSTFNRLLVFRHGQPTLARRMRQSMARDKLAPLLTEPHLRALDRRLNIVLQAVYNCTTKLNVNDVIIDDGF